MGIKASIRKIRLTTQFVALLLLLVLGCASMIAIVAGFACLFILGLNSASIGVLVLGWIGGTVFLAFTDKPTDETLDSKQEIEKEWRKHDQADLLEQMLRQGDFDHRRNERSSLRQRMYDHERKVDPYQ